MSVEAKQAPGNGRTASGPAKTARGSETVQEIPAMNAIIGYKLRRAQLAVFQDFIETFAKMKLRPAEFSVLSIISSEPGLKQSEIAEMLGIKRANFVALMDSLERRGLAERRKADTDRRSHSLHLTPEGTRFVKKMVAKWREHEERLIGRLGGEPERDRLIGLLDRLLESDAKA